MMYVKREVLSCNPCHVTAREAHNLISDSNYDENSDNMSFDVSFFFKSRNREMFFSRLIP